MAIIKCKMCGGDLILTQGQSVAECEFCGSRQTVPVADNEKKLTLFARANRLRATCDFDKAAGIYESIVADFPEEAEAYWGLVLCKYGIEYVDDPATGKKIPTCHRSSFDSVMDDSNFEQAMENADEIALRVYREEAKQIEGIRKGILEVSSNEQPYDIFICYKETDVNGDRTVDSLLAQDIYDALNTKGYRVFFSRITLEDKLGQAYEPYIFAALNSAKIMLAVGTCYEHYNAVWVKNEWSRYLKIIAQDKNKYLIPCYKGIDAYDIPKEFAHLQGQDMGKVGAIQDLLRGVEKILPKQNPVAVVQERVVVGGSGDNKIASLLDRGNMALEDGDWAKADSFFEDVLNNDSKNAQAYLGKTLAQEKCRTMDAFARKRKNLPWEIKQNTRSLPGEEVHIREMETRYCLPGYLTEEKIRELYQFDLRYPSQVRGHQERLDEEKKYWAEHKQLARAEKFAQGAVAESIAREKQALFAYFTQAVKNAEATELDEKNACIRRYQEHIAKNDEAAAQLHAEALANREGDYEKHLRILKSDPKTVAPLQEAEKFFAGQPGFRDSDALAEHCRKRIRDLNAEADRLEAERKAAEAAEAERLRIAAEKAAEEKRLAEEKAAAAKKKKNIIIGIIAAVLAVVAIAAGVYYKNVIVPQNKRDEAAALVSQGSYEEAIALYQELAEPENVELTKETAVRDLMTAEEYEQAFLWAHRLEDEQKKEAFLAQISEYGMYLPTKYQTGNAGFQITYTEQGWPSKVDGFGSISNDDAFYYEYDADGNLIRCIAESDFYFAQWDFYPGKAQFHVGAETCFEDPSILDGWPLFLMWYSGASHSVYYNNETGYFKEAYYDENGLETQWTETTDSENSGTVQWKKNADGQIIGWENFRWNTGSIIYPDVSDIRYDDHGNMMQVDSVNIYRSYDDQGRIINRSVLSSDYRYEYDEYGRIVKYGYPYGEYKITWEWVNLAGTEELLENRAQEQENRYQEGLKALEEGRHGDAYAAFLSAGDHEGAKQALAAAYAEAEALLSNGDKFNAAVAFYKLKEYQDSWERSMELWDTIAQRETFSVGKSHTVGLKTNGTVLATTYTGANGYSGQSAVSGWNNIVSVSAGAGNGPINISQTHTVALRENGTVVAVGGNNYNQCDVNSWSDIVAVDAGGLHTIGLAADGTVIAVGDNSFGQCDVLEWTDIIAVSAGASHTVGLKSDGTVVAVGNNTYGQCDVSRWRDIVAISAGGKYTVALCSDGTVVAVGDNGAGQCNVSDWTDVVSICAFGGHTVGLRSDGTVVAVGNNIHGPCDVSDWTDIVAISAGSVCTIGLKADGTLIVAGANLYGEKDVSDWTDIKLPD